jgi:amino acid transporter
MASVPAAKPPDVHPETGRDETEEERVDRNLQEMLGELRVALPGVQVLFAFLLVVPFNQRFSDVTSFEKTVYFVTLLLTAASAICLIAPSAHHRLEFRRQNKAAIVRTGNTIVVVGLALLGVAMTGAVLFVTAVLYDSATTTIAAGCVALAFAILWYGIPLRRRLRR